MIKCNSLFIDSGELMDALRPLILEAFAKAEDRLLDLMEREVMQTVHGDGPGKPQWRTRIRNGLAVVEEM